MVFRVPTKRQRPPSIAASGSSSNGRLSQDGSSPTVRARAKKLSQRSSIKRPALRNASERTTSATTLSDVGSQQPDVHPGKIGRLDVASPPERDADMNDKEEEDDHDSMNEVVMAIDLRDRGTVGCAYYVAREEKIYMMEDVKFGGIEIVETCETDLLSF